jgi:lipoprotein-releasing system permease protein|tara:strand:- start:2975 stop:4207 length:1233 start_codon:yes stop_codon:yes gene_type:complete
LFNKTERLISLRNLRPKKKEGFLKVISIFSFLGIALGVSILIVVMSVMNGFRVDLTNKILGLNPHLIIKPYDTTIDNNFKSLLKKKYPDSKIKMSYSGEGVAMSKELVKGVMVKGVFKKEINKSDFLINKLVKGSFKNFEKGTVFIGNELAISLGITIGEKINLMSSAFLITPIGSVPKQDSYTVSGIFVTGFYEFDQNLVFLNINDSLSFFNKSSKDLNLNMYLDDPLKADQYKKEIMNLSNDYYIYSWTDLNKSFFNALKVERNVMFIILTLIIIVAAFNIISGLTILIKNKTKEIAILRTMGLSSSSITKSFFLTGFTIGFLATVTGIVVGTLFSFYIEEIRLFISTVFNLEIFPAEIYFLDTMPSEINPMSIGIIFIFSIIITSMASFFPARMVSKMNTINALKYE